MAKKRMTKNRSVFLDLVVYSLLALILMAGGFAVYMVTSAVKDLPALANLEPKPQETSFVYDREGNIWTELHSAEYRVPVKIQEIPEHVKNAVLAAEDHRFYQHQGFDLKAIMRALYSNITEKDGLQGGSTITQQLAKTAFLESSRTLKRKIQDVIVSVLLERKYTKDEILEMYLNLIFFGRGAYGIEAASRAYFNKSVTALTVDEACFLAGVLNGPSIYDPVKYPDRALARRNTIIGLMAEYGFISPQEAENYKKRPLSVVPHQPMVVTEGGYFLDYVLKQLLTRYPAEMVYGGGLRIYTSYSPAAQKAAEEAIAKVLDPVFPYKDGQDNIEAASVVLDVKTGQILAMVGGRHHEGMLGWNRAVDAKRQPGSAFKPIAVYVPALEEGMGPATVIDDSPVTWVDPATGEKFSPENYSGVFQGLMTMRQAVRESINVVACKVQDSIGLRKSLDMAERLGITSLVKTPTPDGRSDLTRSLALGGMTYGASPLDMAVAYATIANRGIRVEPCAILKVVDKDGNTLEEHQPKRTIVVSEETSYLMTSMLKDVLTVPGGTGRAANIGKPAAGKTGTTSDWKDAWFCGYTPSKVGVVWMGYDQEKTMAQWKITGGSYPAQIWAAMMKEVTRNDPPEDWKQPASIVKVAVCRKSGLLPGPMCPRSEIIEELFVEDRVPKSPCTYHLPKKP